MILTIIIALVVASLAFLALYPLIGIISKRIDVKIEEERQIEEEQAKLTKLKAEIKPKTKKKVDKPLFNIGNVPLQYGKDWHKETEDLITQVKTKHGGY